ncbi:hypothetical protein [Intrasporangium oryzae]|uniref:hypothetical protein n=1 Tax=Intrasporangium oryzae TaxID=412687 RepID=UPI0012F7C649|nr:hypothetical protein [Intrasporangium oryzae]
MLKDATFLGLGADVWFQGFLGAVLAGLVSVLVAWITARGQVKVVGQQVEQERLSRQRANYEKAASELLEQLPALADRARVYASARRQEAIEGRKYDNLYNDARREVAKRLTLLGDRPLRRTIAETPVAFQRYAQCFANSFLLQGDVAERSTIECAETLGAYVATVVDLIYEDWASSVGTTRSVELPNLLMPLDR